MNTVLEGVVVSPVNMKERKTLGIRVGDTVAVHQKIEDKGKTRIQVFEGLVLARKHGDEPGATFTVRKVASGIGVEKIFPLYSPAFDKIEITKRSKVRRSKLYYIREKVAREIRRQMRRMSIVSISTESEQEMKIKAEAEAKRVEEEARVAEEALQKEETENAEVEIAQEKTKEKAEEIEKIAKSKEPNKKEVVKENNID